VQYADGAGNAAELAVGFSEQVAEHPLFVVVLFLLCSPQLVSQVGFELQRLHQNGKCSEAHARSSTCESFLLSCRRAADNF